MNIFAERLLYRGTWLEGARVHVEGGRVTDISAACMPLSGDACVYMLVPGLIDCHIHGAHGFAFYDMDMDALSEFLKFAAGEGVMGLYVTLATAPAEKMRAALEFYERAICLQRAGELPGARMLGVHLEGPYLNPVRKGGMNDEWMRAADVDDYERVFGEYADIIKIVTIAPEIPGGLALGDHLARRLVIVQAGHTDADYETAERAFGGGFTSLCHTFNAARGIHHREPGVLTSAFLNPNVYCEAIGDLKHLHPAALKLIYALKGAGRMQFISDCGRCACLSDGVYGDVRVTDGAQSLLNGTLCGGGAMLGRIVKNAASIGIPLIDACVIASKTPAEKMRLNLGEIEIGNEAFFTVFDRDLKASSILID